MRAQSGNLPLRFFLSPRGGRGSGRDPPKQGWEDPDPRGWEGGPEGLKKIGVKINFSGPKKAIFFTSFKKKAALPPGFFF